MGNKQGTKRSFGAIRKLPSGRFQARYTGPDGREYKAPETFAAKLDAEAWLTDRRREIDRELWSPEAARPEKSVPTLSTYSADWLKTRQVAGRPIKDRTRMHYQVLLDAHILPTFGDTFLNRISPDDVRRWHAELLPQRPTMRAHSYSLLKTILASAANADLIAANPCKVENAATARRKSKTKPATLDQVATIVENMPDRLQLMVLLATWCALRFGELIELRRKDIHIDYDDGQPIAGYISVTRAAVRLDAGKFLVTTPKSDAGVRDVNIPPHLIPAVVSHLTKHVDKQQNAMMFPTPGGKHMQPASLYRHFYPAREAAGRPDLRFHDLRHTGAVLAAQTGATLAELMNRLGHSTPTAAMRYQHAAQGRDKAIAEALSAMVLTDP